MSISLDSLDAKVTRVLSLCDSLRAENEALRQRVAGLDAEKTALTQRIDLALERLEALQARLPDA